MTYGLQLNHDKSKVLTIGTSTQLLQAATSTTSSVSVAGVDLPVAEEMKVLDVVVLDRRTVVWRSRVTSQPWQGRATTTPKPSVTSGIY